MNCLIWRTVKQPWVFWWEDSYKDKSTISTYFGKEEKYEKFQKVSNLSQFISYQNWLHFLFVLEEDNSSNGIDQCLSRDIKCFRSKRNLENVVFLCSITRLPIKAEECYRHVPLKTWKFLEVSFLNSSLKSSMSVKMSLSIRPWNPSPS